MNDTFSFPELTIALPAFNEAPNIEGVVAATLVLVEEWGVPAEVLIVDDGSTDGTGQIADRLARAHSLVRVLHHPTNLGFSGAMRSCFDEARGEWLFLAPSDGQIDIDYARVFYENRADNDVIIGVRDRRVDGLHRLVLSWAFHFIARRLFGLPFREFSLCFLFRSALVRETETLARPSSAAILPELLSLLQRKAKIAEIPVRHLPRRAGEPKGGRPSVALRTLIDMARIALARRTAHREGDHARRHGSAELPKP